MSIDACSSSNSYSKGVEGKLRAFLVSRVIIFVFET